MKKSMKKYLIFALVVAILATVAAFSVSAANASYIYCSTDGMVQAVLGNTVEAQCDDDGYTELVCPTCKAVIGQTNIIAALGHKLELDEYELTGGTHYEKKLECTREGCGYKEVENDKGVAIKYCKVNFINDFVTDTYEDKSFCPYAELAKTYKTEIETRYVEYPAQGESVLVSASGIPFRMADRVFGKYIFAGWLSDKEIMSMSSATQTKFDLSHDTNKILTTNRVFNAVENRFEYNEKDSIYYDSLVKNALEKKEITTTTPADYNLYAIFEVKTNVEHSVKFYNYDGYLLYETTANHATQTAEYEGVEPRRPDSAELSFEFLYWEELETGIVLNSGYDIGAVYGDLRVEASYNPIVRQYKLKYFERDGKTPVSDVVDIVTLASIDGKRMMPEYGLSLGKLPPLFDSAYDYIHTGKWMIPSRNNYVVDLNNVSLPNGVLGSDEGIDYIVLVPQYQSYARMYKLVVKIIYDDDDNYHPRQIKLQVTDSNGKGIGYAAIDQSEEYYKDGTYTVVFDVPYSQSYTVTATATGYSGTANTVFHTFDPDERDDDKPGNVLLTMKKIQGDPCGCICHTIFKPVWVGVLNLLNALFRVEFVCCDDMFANIGSELNYGPATSK